MTNKKLLLVDYQLDNIQNIQQIKTDDTDIKIITNLNDLNNIDIIYDKIGLLQNIEINNVNKKIELINEHNYNIYLNIDFNYETTTFNYEYNDTYVLELKNFTYGGVFYVSNSTLNCIINNENGTITINNNDVGEYSFYVNYNIFSLNIKKKITFNILPIISYDDVYNIYDNTVFNSPKPTIIPNNLNGIFNIISDNLPININTDGSFVVEYLNIGNYEFTINYHVNKILLSKTIKLLVKSIINYSSNTYEIKYNETLIIDKPSINNKYIGGEFSVNQIDGIRINKETGELIINENKKLNTDLYELTINYLTFQIKLNIIIIPNIIYKYEKLIENHKIIIQKPVINSSSTVIFYVNMNNVTIKNNGTIILTNYEAGTYNIIITVTYNNNTYYLNLPIVILPFIEFNNIDLIFGDSSKFTFDYFKTMGQISIIDTNNNDYTNIINNILLPTGKYNFIVNYTKGFQIINKELIVNISPKIIYQINKYNINDNIEIEILENSNNGIFLYKGSDIKINEKTGLITVNNPQVKEYVIDYIYKFQNIEYYKNIKFTVLPYVKYEKQYNFYYGVDNIIDKPIVNPSNGVFVIDNHIINNDGSILLDKNLEIGTYNINVYYTFNKITTQIPIKIIIMPNVIYNKNFMFDKNFINTIKPKSLLHNDVSFRINNNLFNINNQGEITINDIDIGLYTLKIFSTIASITTTNIINIHILPNIIYEELNHNINYGNEYIINKPEIKDIGGYFSIENNIAEINNITGEIKINNNLLPGIYNFNVIYTLNNSEKKINFNVNIYPNLKYDIINIPYNKKSYSEKPIFAPLGGIFTCIYDKNVLIDNKTGILIFSEDNDVGNYNIIVKYIYNNIFTEFNCTYNILPIIDYNKEYNFTNNNFKIKPNNINPKNGNFKLDNNNFVINKNGLIKLKKLDLMGTYYLNIEYEKNIKVNNKIKINIEPEFKYTDIVINYKENIHIIPNININGIFSLLNYDDIFKINDTGIITNKILIDVGKYELKINYKIDEIIINKTINVTVLPKINIESEQIMYEPENGIIEIKKNNKLSFGLHDVEIVYTYNNISVTKKTTFNKKITLEYEKNITIIKGIETSYNPIINHIGGKFKINNKNKYIIINENTGIITINKDIDIGNYNIKIEYIINDIVTSTEFNFIVLSIFNYNASIYEFNYGENVNIVPNINSHSEFYILPETNGIHINKNNGILTLNDLDVGSYNFTVNCFSYGQILNTTIKINILPVINYSETLINIKYGNSYLSNIPKIYPENGIFYTNSTIINLNNDGSFSINDNIDVNIYYFDIIYEINNMKSTKTIKVIINPIFEYKCYELVYDCDKEYFTDMPKYYPKDGIFTIVNQPYGITIKKNGIIHIDKNTSIGSYDLSILYKINKINLTNTINIKILPQFYYNTIDVSKYNKYFIGYYKNKNIDFENLNDIFQYDKIINTSKPNFKNNGYFTIFNPLSDVNINGDDGTITLKNNNIGIYNVDVNYNVLNINKTYHYCTLITPLINYEFKTYSKQFNTLFIINKPTVNPEGGVFYFPETYDYFTINYGTGEIICKNNAGINIYKLIVFYELNGFVSFNEISVTVLPDTFINDFETTIIGKNIIKINNYYDDLIIKNYKINNEHIEIVTTHIGIDNINLIANYKNIEFSINFKIKVMPIIKYENDIYYVEFGKNYIINKPIISYDNGCFEILNKIKGITIDKITGEIYVFDKLAVNNYNIIINHYINDVITQLSINIIIKPILNYDITTYEFFYGDNIMTDIPKIIPTNGTFSIENNDINIENNGIVIIKNSKVGVYNFNVIYTVNNVSVTSCITIIIKPNIKYDDNYIITHGTEMKIKPNLLNPPDHIVTSLKLPPNIEIDNSTGIISVSSNCEPNNYPIQLKYIVNDIESVINTNIKVDIFNEKTKTINIYHGNNDIIDLKNIANYNIVNNKKFYIKDNKIYTYNLDIETYNLKINYKINKLSEELNYIINVFPNIVYNSINEFIYGNKILIQPVLYSPQNGSFKLVHDFFVIDKYGCITQKHNTELSINTYDLNVEYMCNKIKSIYSLKIIIIPFLEYNKTIYEGVHNEILTIDSPNYLPKKLNFSVELGEIDQDGKILISNLNIGKYSIKVNYDITSVILDVIIKPVFFYNDNNSIIDFGINKSFIPSISQNNGTFYIKEHNNIIINEKTGIVNINNLLPNHYTIIVYYLYNDIEVSTELNITIIPILKYNNNNLLIKYKTDMSISPIFNPLGGTFYTDSNVNIDESNGKISINDANIGNYNIIVYYSYNKQIVSHTISFDVIPVVSYDSYNFTFYNGIENKIEKPYVAPNNGKFILNCDTYLSKYLSICNNGSIIIKSDINVGNYDFSVIYSYSIKFSLTILPYIYYENVVLDYQNNSFILEPHFLISNHGIYDFSIVNYDLILFTDGKITNFNCLNVGTYKIYVNYKHLNKSYQTYFICQIMPIIKTDFIERSIYLFPNNGKLEYNNKYFEIKENKFIYKNIYDNTIIPLTYIINNVSKQILIKYLSTPINIFDSNINVIYSIDTVINSYVSNGIIFSDDKPSNLKIINLSLNIENLDVGTYSFTINYLVNELTYKQFITLTIYPKFNYENKYFEICANLGNTTEQPIINPDNGKFSIKQFIKNINVNTLGLINSFNTLPNIYNITVQYTVNKITSFDNITIYCKPSLILQTDTYTINYGDQFIINNFKCFPYFGSFEASIPIKFNKNEIIFNYLEHLNIGIHTINLDYIYNNIKTTTNITLTILPTIIYNKNYKTTYGKTLVIDSPILSHKNGSFNIDINTDNLYKTDNIIILNDGSINISNKLEIGKYLLSITYIIDKLSVTDVITLTVEPYLYYDENILTLIFNKNHPKYHINAPKFYPNYGIFYIDSQIQNITINKNGIIELDNLNIGNYEFNVFYKFNKTVLKTPLKINMNPYINYNLSVVNIKYKTIYFIEQPDISNIGGIFSSKTLPRGVILNSKTGSLTLNQKDFIDVGFYNIIINYNINNLTTTANIYVNIT